MTKKPKKDPKTSSVPPLCLYYIYFLNLDVISDFSVQVFHTFVIVLLPLGIGNSLKCNPTECWHRCLLLILIDWRAPNECKKDVRSGDGELLPTTQRWPGPVPRQQAAGSSCSWAACFLCSSRAPTGVTRTARRWPGTAGTSWCDSAGRRWAGSGRPPCTSKREGGRALAICYCQSFLTTVLQLTSVAGDDAKCASNHFKYEKYVNSTF